jgi:hypothetical protein
MNKPTWDDLWQSVQAYRIECDNLRDKLVIAEHDVQVANANCESLRADIAELEAVKSGTYEDRSRALEMLAKLSEDELAALSWAHLMDLRDKLSRLLKDVPIV